MRAPQGGNRRRKVYFRDVDDRTYIDLLAEGYRLARTGRPLGSDAFLSLVESLAECSLRDDKPGPKLSREKRLKSN